MEKIYFRCDDNSANVGNVDLRTNSDSINLIDYIEVLASNWRMIAKVTLIGAAVSIVVSLGLPKRYSSTAKILPPMQDSSLQMFSLMGPGNIGNVVADLFGKNTSTDIYMGILDTDTVRDKIIDRFKLMDVYGEEYRANTYRQLNKFVEIIAGKKDGIISITVEDKEPKRAAEIANAYVEELDKLVGKLNVTGANQNRLFYEDRLSKAKIDLANAEEALKIFQSRNKALDITEQVKGTFKGVGDLEGQLALEEIKLSVLRRSLTESSQEIKSQRATISTIKSQIAKFEGSRGGAAIPGVGSVPEMEQQFLRLMRTFKIQESIVELLTKQYEMARISEAKESSAIIIIQKAAISDKKSKPKRGFIVAATTVVSCLAAIFYAFLREAGGRISGEDRIRWNKIIEMLPSFHSFKRKR